MYFIRCDKAFIILCTSKCHQVCIACYYNNVMCKYDIIFLGHFIKTAIVFYCGASKCYNLHTKNYTFYQVNIEKKIIIKKDIIILHDINFFLNNYFLELKMQRYYRYYNVIYIQVVWLTKNMNQIFYLSIGR